MVGLQNYEVNTVIQQNWKDLIQANLSVEPGEQSDREATIIAEPLERGFGLTLGNALRREPAGRRNHLHSDR